MSVRPSVCPWQWHRLEILETNCTDIISPTPSLFVAQTPYTYSQRFEYGEILERLEVGWGKVACWSTKRAMAISLKRVKIVEKLLWRAYSYRNSPVTSAISNSTIPDMLQPPLPQDWGFATPLKTSIAIISRKGKATDFKFGRYIHRVHPDKSPLKFWRKGSVGISI